MRMHQLLAAVAIGGGPLLATMFFVHPAAADFLWFGAPKAELSLSVVVEDNVRGGCWQDREATLAHVAQTLERYSISVSDRAPTNLVLYAIGHPSATGRFRKRLACVGVLQIRVSELDVAEDRSFRVTSLYDQERLLVSHDVLDTAIGSTVLELVDNFSRRYAETRD